METSPEKLNEGKKTDAVNHINMLITQCGQFGGNNSEFPDMMRLIDDVKNGDKSPDQAIAEADEIFHEKNGMHTHYR